ncbi:FG-GAP repeat domain-containing protein [Streptomyces qinzhouensis]|uniref:VCBS repeat-containing protein n=1 Tax=Streptomyces qinzhouensis TaxID=2599401 RepID=A0A5B8IJN3_9ACTN|nr:VCBS repeat-containing protein [Streptomyces qinzhouensis]QDY78722.1 VCBS repeat-containing protein [Streptomyces qinzhouensis]
MRTPKKAVIGAALLPALTLTLGAVGTGLATEVVLASPAAAADRAWDKPQPLTGVDASAADKVVITPNGTAVAVWTRGKFGRGQEVWSAVRTASASAWSKPVRIAGDQEMVSDLSVASGRDGAVVVTWHRLAQGWDNHLLSSLLPGAAEWSQPVSVPGVALGRDLVLLARPDGGFTAAWYGLPADEEKGVFTAELPALGGTWSKPSRVTTGTTYELRAAIAADGAVTLAWQDRLGDRGSLRVSTRAAGTDAWSESLEVDTGKWVPTDVSVQTSPSGATLLSWNDSLEQKYKYRPAGSASWGTTEQAPSGSEGWKATSLLLEPDGRVTVVWPDYPRALTSTRALNGIWSQPRPLGDIGSADFWTPSVGRDGTFVAMGSVVRLSEPDELWAVTRSDGVWGKPVLVGRGDIRDGGTVGALTNGRGVGLWTQEIGGTLYETGVNQVWTATTGNPRPSTTTAERRDMVGDDGMPDLYARRPGGSLVVYEGNTSGTLRDPVDGGAWPATSTLIPFGDLNGDRANDTLVVDAAGELWRHQPPRGTPVTAKSPHWRIGSGWKGFDGLTYSGDFNADGLPDLVARQTATGDLYLFAGTKAGKLTRTGRIGTGWKGLKIVGAGDLNGDRRADLIARTAKGDLYRYYGTGKGTISSGTKIGSGWGGMADFVGIGDLTGDGKDDVLGRTTTGALYRYAGNGAGNIGSGVKIGSGWHTFTGIG